VAIDFDGSEGECLEGEFFVDEEAAAREVVTRVLKKLESDGKVEQTSDGIKIISEW
jgi:hypothetical protein